MRTYYGLCFFYSLTVLHHEVTYASRLSSSVMKREIDSRSRVRLLVVAACM